MGNSIKRISFFYIIIISILLILFPLAKTILAQETDSIYVETITINVDSQELINLEQEITEIPVDYELISLTENFLMSYEQLSLNVIQFKYELNYYFVNLIYNSLTGYSSLLYYSSSYGSTFFQGLTFWEVYPYLPFCGFHFFKNSFELERNFVNWNIALIISFESYNLPEIESLKEFSSIYSNFTLKGQKGNFNFSFDLFTISFNEEYIFFLFEKLALNYNLILNKNIYMCFSLNQFYGSNFYLKPGISIVYDFPEVKFKFYVNYNTSFNDFYGLIKFSYITKVLKFLFLLEKEANYQPINEKYISIKDENFTFFNDYANLIITFEYKKNDSLILGVTAGYSWYWVKSILFYNNAIAFYQLMTIHNNWSIFSKFNFDWKINELLLFLFNIQLNLPSYFINNESTLGFLTESFLETSISVIFFVDNFSKLRFSIDSEILRFFLGLNDPIYKIEIEYKIEKQNYDISFLLALNLNQYNILPGIYSSIFNLNIFSQIYF